MVWKPFPNEEALKARAELLHTAPLEIAQSDVNSMSSTDKAFIQGLYSLNGNRYVLPAAALPLSDADRFRVIECLGLANGIEMIRTELLYTAPLKIPQSNVDLMSGADKAFIQALYTLDGNRYVLPATALPLSDADRLRAIECLGLAHGLEMGVIKPDRALLEVHFFNRNYLKEVDTDPSPPHALFMIEGGQRLKAGDAEGQVKVTSIQVHAHDPVMTLEVKIIGDYSTYTLMLDTMKYPKIDPLFNDIPFKFRPGCFKTDCAPQWQPGKARPLEPAIDYLAKDYDSFKHTLIAALMERVPGWQSSSEADLDQVLLEKK
jgi:hypothetical protein